MTVQSTAARAIVLTLLTLSVAIFIPVIPNPPVHDDPTVLLDPRVLARISSDDLTQILRLVRGNRLNNAYQRYWSQSRLPLQSISTAEPSLLIGPGQPTVRLAPLGEIEAVFASSCQPRCEEGVTYYFVKRRGSWHITKIEPWDA